ncbi:hypothetical protein C6P40_002130 [Pichia californica]|uniref:CN hydrolase domain-containing protein n=1 Tax=Pichia californica TaxID=460514 RepID=A0A9P7BGY4_9ASCO|nr:hypothetical protein C6P42_001385 [[Candida] californica]KAG0690631.1 hypothetical protein C6P40_002130 [[Candida] californica]
MTAEIKIALAKFNSLKYDSKLFTNEAIELIKVAYEKGAELISFLSYFYPKPLVCGSHIFDSIIKTIKKYPIHVILHVSENDYNFLCIIESSGKIILKRKDCYIKQNYDLKTVVYLKFKQTDFIEVGYLCGVEHVNPLMTYNSALQHEKLHFGSWPIINDNGNKDLVDFISRTYSVQTQSFFISNSANLSAKNDQNFNIKVFAPDGSIVTKHCYDEEGITFYKLNMDEIINQKALIDIVGHSSKPTVTFQSIIDYNSL